MSPEDRVCTFSPEQREAQGKTHSRSAVINPISQMRKRRAGKSDSPKSHPRVSEEARR